MVETEESAAALLDFQGQLITDYYEYNDSGPVSSPFGDRQSAYWVGDLAIEGDIGLSVFPWLGVELHSLALSQPEGFGDEPFVSVEHAQVRAKLMPLLEKKLEVDTVQLDGLRLSLTAAAGVTGRLAPASAAA